MDKHVLHEMLLAVNVFWIFELVKPLCLLNLEHFQFAIEFHSLNGASLLVFESIGSNVHIAFLGEKNLGALNDDVVCEVAIFSYTKFTIHM